MKIDLNLDIEFELVIKSAKVGDVDVTKELSEDEKAAIKEVFIEEFHGMKDALADKWEAPLETEIDVDYKYSAGSKERFDSNFGNWLPGDPEDIDLKSVDFGTTNILPGLSDEQVKEIEEKAATEARE